METVDVDQVRNKLDELLRQVLVKLDFPRNSILPPAQLQHNLELQRKYWVQGFPTVLLLDSEGRRIAATGYLSGGAEEYVRHLREIAPRK